MQEKTKTNAMRILEKEKIPYIPHEYSHEGGAVDGITVAERLGMDPARVFKTLVTRGTKEIYVFDIPVTAELDLKKAAKAVGEKSIEMVHVDEINKLTGYVRGGCSPIGMTAGPGGRKKQYKTIIDSSAANFDTITVSAGRIGCQIELSPAELQKLTGAVFAEVTT